MSTPAQVPQGQHGDIILVDGGWSPISLAIKRRTLSDWSHVGILVNELTAKECRIENPKWVKNGGDGPWVAEALPGGFCLRRASVYQSTPWRVRTFTTPLDADEQMLLRFWCRQTVGTPYDWPGVLFGHVTRRPTFADNAKLFCSEATTQACRYMGREVISGDVPSGLVPPHFFAVTGGVLKTTGWHIRKPDGWPE